MSQDFYGRRKWNRVFGIRVSLQTPTWLRYQHIKAGVLRDRKKQIRTTVFTELILIPSTSWKVRNQQRLQVSCHGISCPLSLGQENTLLTSSNAGSGMNTGDVHGKSLVFIKAASPIPSLFLTTPAVSGIGTLEARFQLLNWNLPKGLLPYREPSRTWLHLHPKGTKDLLGSWETLLIHRPSFLFPSINTTWNPASRKVQDGNC